MPRLTIPDEATYAIFNPVTSTSAFAITFSLFAKADLRVSVDGEELTQSDFSFSGTLLDDGGYDGGTVTLNTAVDDVQVIVWREIKPVRTTNYAPSNSVPVRTFDGDMNRQTARQQDLRRDVARGLLVPFGETGMQIPPVAERAGKIALFNDDGELVGDRNLADFDADLETVEAAVPAIVAARDSALSDIDTNKDAALSAISSQQATSIAAVAAQQTTSVNAVQDAESEGVAAVEAAASDITALVPVIEETAALVNEGGRFDDGERMARWIDEDDREVAWIGLDGAFRLDQEALNLPGGITLQTFERMEASARIPVTQLDADGEVRIIGWIGEDPTATPVTERLDVTLTATGVPLMPTLNMHTLRRTRTRMRQLRAGVSTRFVLNCGEDSYGQNSSGWVTKLGEYLFDELADGGGGWTGFGGLNTLNGNVRPSDYVVTIGAGFSRLSPKDPVSPDLCWATSSTDGSTITVVYPATPTHSGVDLYWIGTAAGEVSVSIDGGAAQSIDVSGSGLGVTALTGDLSGGGTIVITVVGNNEVNLAGLHFKSTAAGVVINKVAASGTAIDEWVSDDGTAQATFLTNSSPDLICWIGGTNTRQNKRSTAEFQADLETFIDRQRAARPGLDILIGMEPENNIGGIPPYLHTMAEYAAVAREVCWEKSVAFIDFQSFFGAALVDYDKDSAVPLMASDNVHPSIAGYALMVGVLLEETPLGAR